MSRPIGLLDAAMPPLQVAPLWAWHSGHEWAGNLLTAWVWFAFLFALLAVALNVAAVMPPTPPAPRWLRAWGKAWGAAMVVALFALGHMLLGALFVVAAIVFAALQQPAKRARDA